MGDGCEGERETVDRCSRRDEIVVAEALADYGPVNQGATNQQISGMHAVCAGAAFRQLFAWFGY